MNHQSCFLDIKVGWRVSVHDAHVFANSEPYSKGERKTLFPPKVREINGVSVPLVILGDPAHPLPTVGHETIYRQWQTNSTTI